MAMSSMETGMCRYERNQVFEKPSNVFIHYVLYFSVTQNLQFSIGVVAQGQEEAMVETN